MSDEKKDFFDYDTYIQSNVGKIKNGGKSKKPEHIKVTQQKPPKLVPADESTDKPHKKQARDSIESIKKMFGEALDESKEELAEFADEEPAVPDAPIANPEGIRRKLYYLFGVAFGGSHDIEDTILTIRRMKKAYSPWSSKLYGLRHYPDSPIAHPGGNALRSFNGGGQADSRTK